MKDNESGSVIKRVKVQYNARVVDGIVQNKYSDDPGKLAAWLSSKHVEKDPKKKEPPTP